MFWYNGEMIVGLLKVRCEHSNMLISSEECFGEEPCFYVLTICRSHRLGLARGTFFERTWTHASTFFRVFFQAFEGRRRTTRLFRSIANVAAAFSLRGIGITIPAVENIIIKL